jgi:DNA repair protein RadC
MACHNSIAHIKNYGMLNDLKATLSIVSEVQLSYKSKIKASDRPVVTNSRSVFELLKEIWDEDSIELYESFKVLFLNKSHRVIGMYPLSTGGISGTVADPRLIYIAALKIAACGIILAHNHPSGGLNPSRADIDLTEKIKMAGKLLDIIVLDHLIITPEAYYSFADQGLL